MKKALLFILTLFLTDTLHAQQEWAENARRELKLAKDDSTRFNLTAVVFNSYVYSYPDSAAPYAQQMILLARKMKSDTALSVAFNLNATLASLTGNYPQALQYAFESLRVAELAKYFRMIARAYGALSGLYSDQGDHKRAVYYAKKSMAVFEENFTPSLQMPLQNQDTLLSYIYCNVSLSNALENANQLDSALHYIQFVERAEQAFGLSWAFVPYIFGNIYSKKR